MSQVSPYQAPTSLVGKEGSQGRVYQVQTFAESFNVLAQDWESQGFPHTLDEF